MMLPCVQSRPVGAFFSVVRAAILFVSPGPDGYALTRPDASPPTASDHRTGDQLPSPALAPPPRDAAPRLQRFSVRVNCHPAWQIERYGRPVAGRVLVPLRGLAAGGLHGVGCHYCPLPAVLSISRPALRPQATTPGQTWCVAHIPPRGAPQGGAWRTQRHSTGTVVNELSFSWAIIGLSAPICQASGQAPPAGQIRPHIPPARCLCWNGDTHGRCTRGGERRPRFHGLNCNQVPVRTICEVTYNRREGVRP